VRVKAFESSLFMRQTMSNINDASEHWDEEFVVFVHPNQFSMTHYELHPSLS